MRTGMNQQSGGRARPRIRPGMNTETKRHEEKAAYYRKPKYRDDPLDGLEAELEEDEPEEEAASEGDPGEDEADYRGK